jgi:2-polyprenyl-6-methoxyphenol hydroxylase-like FAD-dependent oxidoreductase
VKAVIAGGGIGGLGAAGALRRVGVETVVLEQAASLDVVGAGLVLSENALRALDALGLADDLTSRGAVGERLLARRPDGRVLLEIPLSARGERSLGIHRAVLQEALFAAAGTGNVRLGARCVGFDADGDAVRAAVADGSAEPGDFLVGADGIRSVVRAQLFGDEPPRFAGYAGWRMVAPIVPAVDPQTFSESWGRGMRVGIVPIGEGRVYWFVSETARERELVSGAGAKERFRRVLAGWHAPIPDLVEATSEDAFGLLDIFDRKPRRDWGKGRVTLLGDAAHPMTPNLGQGAGQALEDAVVLAASLKGAADVEAALRRYEAERAPRANRIAKLSRQAGVMAQADSRLGCLLRDGFMRVMPRRLQIAQRDRLNAFDPPTL